MSTIRRQPPTSAEIQNAEIARLIEQAKWNRGAKRSLTGGGTPSSLPGEIGLQLTNRCNLRCVHCFQWGDNGQYKAYSREAQRAELDIGIIEQLLVETRPVNARLYIWGGEPLVYRDFGKLLGLIKRERRWSVICTNGIGIERHAEAIFDASETLAMLFSLDGFKDQNDTLRAPGAFAKTLESIRNLVDAKAAGRFKGEVSVAAVISEGLIGRINEFVQFIQDLGVNTLHLNFPWYISSESARRMDELYNSSFGWLRDMKLHSQSGPPSWHAYTFRLPDTAIGLLQEELESLHARSWRVRLKVQPLLSRGEVAAFVQGSETPPLGHSRCVSIATRLSVLPNGGVTTCKLFPEFTIGNLHDAGLDAIWNGSVATHAREILSRGLTPICSRCVQLYLNRAEPMFSEPLEHANG